MNNTEKLPTTIIRNATPEDVPVMTALWLEKITIIGQVDPRFAGRYEQKQTWITWIADHLDHPAYCICVAEKEGIVTGYIAGLLRTAENNLCCGIVSDIALDAHNYHGGLGRQLVSRLKDWFGSHKTDIILINAPRHYAAEQAFWRSLGAKEWLDNQWESPVESIWMKL